jgi:hypothetical protein
MDPASVAGLIVLAGQIANAIYKYGQRIRNAQKEIDQLCIDLFALKGTLEHVRLHIESCKLMEDVDESSSSTLSITSQIFVTDEFNAMLSSTDVLLKDLYKLLDRDSDRKRAAVQRLIWPLTKGEIQDYVGQLEKLKSYFILAITSDNLEVSKQIYFEVHSLGQMLRSQQENDLGKADAEHRRAVSQWLTQQYESSELHEKALSARQEGTGKWFLAQTFQNWSRGEDMQILVGKFSVLLPALSEEP